MPRYYWDCHHYNGYTGDCLLKGGNCSRVCQKYLTDEEFYEQMSETDEKISLAKLREICLSHTDRFGTLRCSVDLLIKTIKQDLAKK